jgi:hypothetical protein
VSAARDTLAEAAVRARIGHISIRTESTLGGKESMAAKPMKQKKRLSRRTSRRPEPIRLLIEIYRLRPAKRKSAARARGSLIPPGALSIKLRAVDKDGNPRRDRKGVLLQATLKAEVERLPRPTPDSARVALQRPAAVCTRDQAFWSLI